MTTYSGILAWKIPWTAEPGGLKSMTICKRVRHNWNDLAYPDMSHTFCKISDNCCSRIALKRACLSHTDSHPGAFLAALANKHSGSL